jgi:nucleotide-binding universal stress UspA family protein
MMYRSLLVPLDGSASAEQALPLALGIARRAGARLDLVSVQVPFPPVYGEGMARLENPLEAEAREKARSYLDGVVQRIAAVSPVPVAATLLDGPVAESLYRKATATDVDLVVMTVIGAGPWTRLWLGSVADELVRRLPMPLLLLRPQEPAPELGREPAIKHILLPLDGSVAAEQIVEPAAALATLMQAEFTLLRVVNPVASAHHAPAADSGGMSRRQPPPMIEEQLQADAQAYLDRVAQRLRARSLPVQTRVVLHEHPAVTILDAHAHDTDLIAFTTRGDRALPWLFLGSTADKLLRGASTPVLVQRPLDQSIPQGAPR